MQTSPPIDVQRRQRGFTLLEIMLVMALVAAAMAIVAAAVSHATPGAQLRNAAKGMAQDMRRARAEAMQRQLPQRFTLDLVQRRWSIDGHDAKPLPRQVDARMTSARELQPRTGSGSIIFFPDGASSGGRVSLQQGAQRWDIDVNWITSEVTLAVARGS